MTSDPVVITLVENETKITTELTPEQARLLDRNYRKFLSVAPAWQTGAFELTAKQYVGAIVADGLRIHIEPKVPITNLFFMLTYAYDLARFRDEESPLAIGKDLFEFLIQILVKQVDQLVRKGIYRGYLDYEANDRYLRGRLMLARQLQRNTVQIQRFYQRNNEFTPDLLENRILKFTLWQLLRSGPKDAELRLHLRRSLSAFSEVSLTPLAASDCDGVLYTRLNSGYQTPINLCKLILQHLSLEGYLGETPFVTYLLPMYRVFELFVARYLEEHFSVHPSFDIDIQPPQSRFYNRSAGGRRDQRAVRRGGGACSGSRNHRDKDTRPVYGEHGAAVGIAQRS